jgi:hypothetical protein
MENLTLDRTAAQPLAERSPVAAPRRHDIYQAIHKTMRNFMFDVVKRVGCMDTNDPESVRGALAEVRDLLAACTLHLEMEDRFIHPAMEARRRLSSAHAATDHGHHEIAIDEIEADVQAVERAAGPALDEAALHLYRRLALFTAENLEHMHVEETENNATLWATHEDAEIAAIEQSIHAALAPTQKLSIICRMIPALPPAERAGMLTRMQREAPPEVFAAVLAGVRPQLAEGAWARLMSAIAPVPPVAR